MIKTLSLYESVTPDLGWGNATMPADPNELEDMQQDKTKPLQATARIEVCAGASEVQDLAKRIFGECTFDPPSGVAAMSGEPVMFVKTASSPKMQNIMYFSRALDKNTGKYKVSYIMPDKDHGPTSIRVVFFKGFKPSR